MKLLKRITSFVLVVEMVTLMPFTGGVKADEISAQNCTVQTEREYVIDELGYYLSGWDVDSDAVVKMSGRYDINNAENDSSIYFVQVDEKTVGAVTVSEYEGERISSFMYTEDGFEEMPENEEMSVSSNGEGIDICTKEETKVLSGKDAGKTFKGKDTKYKRKKLKYYNVTEKVNVDSEAMEVEMTDSGNDDTTGLFSVAPQNVWNTDIVNIGTHKKTYDTIMNYKQVLLRYMVKVPFRQNYVMDGAGICWAASGASIISFKKEKTYTTRTIYNDLKSYYKDTPNGSSLWTERMFRYYGISMQYIDHKLPFSIVLRKMEFKKPIYCVFYHYDGDRQHDYSHSVVLCGCYYRTDLGRYYYVYMDPNSDKYIVNHILPSVLSTDSGYKFYYNDGTGNIYNNWTRTAF